MYGYLDPRVCFNGWRRCCGQSNLPGQDLRQSRVKGNTIFEIMQYRGASYEAKREKRGVLTEAGLCRLYDFLDFMKPFTHDQVILRPSIFATNKYPAIMWELFSKYPCHLAKDVSQRKITVKDTSDHPK